MKKRIILFIVVVLLLIATVGYAGDNLRAGLEKIQSHRTYQEFYEMPDWASWTASEKANHITAKVFDMEEYYTGELIRLELENQALKKDLFETDNENVLRSEQQTKILLSIVMLLQSKK